MSLSAIAVGVVEALRRESPERAAEVVVAPDVKVYADGGLMCVLLENLLGNAWKFTARAASPRIEFGVNERGGVREYFVRDNGAGFDMDYADKLFSPFQRLHTEAEFPGTGIGLATVQRIVSCHGGRVTAAGEVGRGATIAFTIPSDSTSAASALAARSPPPSA